MGCCSRIIWELHLLVMCSQRRVMTGHCRRDAQGMEKRMCWKNYLSILILKSPRIMTGPMFNSIYSDPGLKSSRNEGKWSQGWKMTATSSGYHTFFHLSPSYKSTVISRWIPLLLLWGWAHSHVFKIYLYFLFCELSIDILCLFLYKGLAFVTDL